MKLKFLSLIVLMLILSCVLFSCKKDSQQQMETLQQNLQSTTPSSQGPSKSQTSPPSSTLPTEVEKITEDEIQNIIKNKVDGFQVKGLSKMDLSPMVMATTEFIEITSINFFNNDTICEVGFSYYLIPEELKNQDSIESDGMIFDASKQYQQGLGIFQHEANGWKLISLVNEFRQLDFLPATERR